MDTVKNTSIKPPGKNLDSGHTKNAAAKKPNSTPQKQTNPAELDQLFAQMVLQGPEKTFGVPNDLSHIPAEDAEAIIKSLVAPEAHALNPLIKAVTGVDMKDQAPSSPPSKWAKHPVVKTLSKFLDDHWGIRMFFALGNEIAESLEPSLEGLGVPKAANKAIYKGLWALSLFCTSNRVVMKGIQENNLLGSLKILIQDGIAAIGGPTVVARTANAIQNKIYDSLKIPDFIKNIVRPAFTLFTCKKAVHALDPVGIWVGYKIARGVAKATGRKYNPPKEDHGHGSHGKEKATKANMSSAKELDALLAKISQIDPMLAAKQLSDPAEFAKNPI